MNRVRYYSRDCATLMLQSVQDSTGKVLADRDLPTARRPRPYEWFHAGKGPTFMIANVSPYTEVRCHKRVAQLLGYTPDLEGLPPEITVP